MEEHIKEIRAYNIEIGYVSGDENPADIASSGESVRNLASNIIWWKGHKWLVLPRDK